jgi:hypothetical protein
MKKLVKMMTLVQTSIEVNADFNFMSNVKMGNVKIGRGGGVRLFG